MMVAAVCRLLANGSAAACTASSASVVAPSGATSVTVVAARERM